MDKEYPLLKDIYSLDIGETFTFGNYEQDNNLANGKEPVEWMLISNNNGNIYAISKYVLDVSQFNDDDTHWDASIYTWLQSDLKNELFTKDEQKDLNRICLLKQEEVRGDPFKNIDPFLDVDKISFKTEFTPYAASKNPSTMRNLLTDEDYSTFWWTEGKERKQLLAVYH